MRSSRSSRYVLPLLLLLLAALSACDSNEEGDPVELPVLRTVADTSFTVTDTGLKYFDFQVGDGPVPDVGAAVNVHYNGWLEDGTLFDSSYLRGRPLTFIVGIGQVIPGWDEGILSMRVGGERQLVIPPELAYGASGTGSIPPNATLIFEVELLEIQ